MLKNVLKYIAFFIAILAIIYFFKKTQSHSTEANVVTESQEVTAEDEVSYENTLPDDFYPFYDRFHTDSLFQLERIIFPLKGIAKSSDSTRIAEETLWQKESWVQHKPFNSHEGTFERVFTNIGGIISEQISANDGLFTLEKRYAKLSDEWHLIYYQELLMNG